MAEYPASKSRQHQKQRQRQNGSGTGATEKTRGNNDSSLSESVRSSRALSPLVITDNLQQRQSTAQNQYPIRHSGRALVRGKFRRVWRPRQLEVLGNGVVKYYELDAAPSTTPVGATFDAFLDATSSTTTTTTSDTATGISYFDDPSASHSNKPPPKATLWIHHARIIDVTTLRDIHVGLPRGAFGFLFHGHPHQTDDDDDEIVYDSKNTTGDYYTVPNHATTTAMTTMMDDNIDLLRVLPMGMVGHGACQGSAQVATSRDFLCAVSSLEEAQSWVIALQWAASMGRESSFQMNPSSINAIGGSNSGGFGLGRTLPMPHTPSEDGTGISRVESWQDDTLSIISSTSRTPPKQPSQSSPAKSKSPIRIKASPTAIKKNKIANKTPPSAGKMVVTKVVGYQWVRLELMQWELAFQIQVLLVMSTQQQQQQQVEEWSILRTANDIQTLLTSFQKKNTGTSELALKLDQQIERMTALPRLHTSSSLSKENLSKAVSTVDAMMRFLCMEAVLVNSSAMKGFLGLQTSATKSSSKATFWRYHQPAALASQRKRTILHQSIGQYVKEWLQQHLKQQKKRQEQQSTLQFQLLCWYLRLPQPSTTYLGMALLSLWISSSILPSLNRFIRKYQVVPFVALRLDALILSWCATAALGYWHRAVAPHDDQHGDLARHGGHTIPSDKTATPTASGATSSNALGPSDSGSRSKVDKRATSIQNKSLMDSDTDVGADSEDQITEENDDDDEDGEEHIDSDTEALQSANSFVLQTQDSRLSSPLPEYDLSRNIKDSCWSKPKDHIFNVRGPKYLTDRVKLPSAKASFTCQGVDMWITDNPERHIARHPSVLGGRLATMKEDMFLVNFLLPFGNFVSYFSIPPLDQFATPQLADVWTRFIQGDQQYRDARLKLLPVVVDGPWIVRAAVPGTSPALLGKAIPLQYFFTQKEGGRSIYEVDVIITASSIAKGILSVVKGHAKALSISFAFIIEAACEKELPEAVLASVQMNALHLEDCPLLPDCNLDAF